MSIRELQNKLSGTGQEQVLRFFDALGEASQKKLAAQIEALDLDVIVDLAEKYVRDPSPAELPRDIEPAYAYPRQPDARLRPLYQEAEERGWQLLKDGKVAAFLVAGGQGTRLGYDGPKGEFPVTPIRNKPLFEVFAEQLLAYGRDAGRPVPWYIMTSDANDQATRNFFHKNSYFGCDPELIFFFQQGMMPAFSMDGKMLLAQKDSLALSPDGHGGSLRALEKSGALQQMLQRGVEHLSYFQVDNPLVQCIDPLFLGLHDLTGSEMSSKTIPKSSALEKVGNFVKADGTVRVIEYSDLPESLAVAADADGGLRFNAGSIAIHALRVSFVHRLNSGGKLSLPWHRAEKKVPFVDTDGRLVVPDAPNAVKLEQFVFDAIPLAKNPLIYTTDRAEEFSPVKNAEGVDSPATCRRDQIRRSARWLVEAGVEVPAKGEEPDAVLEISPLFATSARQLASRALGMGRVRPGQILYLGPEGTGS